MILYAQTSWNREKQVGLKQQNNLLRGQFDEGAIRYEISRKYAVACFSW